MTNYAIVIECNNLIQAKTIFRGYERQKVKCSLEGHNVTIIVEDKSFAEFIVSIVPGRLKAHVEERP